MSRHNDEASRQCAREHAVYRYVSALEHGDFETVVSVLAQAEEDRTLEAMLREVHEVLEAEYDVQVVDAQGREAARVRALVREHLVPGFAADDLDAGEVELPPLTVAAVAMHWSEEQAQRGQLTQEVAGCPHSTVGDGDDSHSGGPVVGCSAEVLRATRDYGKRRDD